MFSFLEKSNVINFENINIYSEMQRGVRCSEMADAQKNP